MKIAIATVFLPRENIYWLEEWIRYHLFHIGIDAIYLYDNTGSLRFDHLPLSNEASITLSGKNYKNENISAATAHISDLDIAIFLEKITSKYSGRVVIIPWHPVDKDGVPCQGQRELYEHFLHNYGDQFDWACLTDIDEFIVNTDFKEKITLFDKKGFNDVIIHPKLFMQRVGPRGPIIPALSITDCVANVTDRNWKQVVKCSEALRPNIHQGGTWRGEWKPIFKTDLIFHHYKVGPWYYQSMSNNILFCPKELEIEADDTLKKVIPLLSLEQNIDVPLPKNNYIFESNLGEINLPPSTLVQKLITAKEYLVVYAILRCRLLRRLWMMVKPDKPSGIKVRV